MFMYIELLSKVFFVIIFMSIYIVNLIFTGYM